jgi:hypothetical protein
MARPKFVGTPKSVVLYRTESGWRWMIVDEKGGMLDGGLRDLPPEAQPEEAQAQFLATLSAVEELEWTATWTAADRPGWWTGELSTAL